MSTPSFNTRLATRVIGTPNVDTEIAELLTCEPPEGELGDIKTSHLQTPDQEHTYRPGWGEPGEVAFSAKFSAETYELLVGKRDARTTETWVIKFPDDAGDPGSEIQFSGYVKKVKAVLDGENDEDMVIEGTIKVSGLPTFTPVA